MSQPGQTKSKELKIVSKQVITADSLKEDKRKIKLLYIIKTLNGVSEKALTVGLYELKQKGLDLGYQFNVIGNNIFSPMIKEDITALLYVGYLENDPKNKKLVITSKGQEFLDAQQIEDEFKNNLNQLLNEVRMKINAINEENRMKGKRR